MSSSELVYFAACCRRMASDEADAALKQRLLDMAEDYEVRSGRSAIAQGPCPCVPMKNPCVIP